MHDTVYCTVFNVLALINCTGHHDAKVGRVRVGGGGGWGAQFYACVPVSAHTPAEHNVKQSSEASP